MSEHNRILYQNFPLNHKKPIAEAIITVPKNYDHRTQIGTFKGKLLADTESYYAPRALRRLAGVTDENCFNETELSPHGSYLIEITSMDSDCAFGMNDYCNNFKNLGGLMVGIRGLTLAYQLEPKIFLHGLKVTTPLSKQEMIDGEGHFFLKKYASDREILMDVSYNSPGYLWGGGIEVMLCYYPIKATL